MKLIRPAELFQRSFSLALIAAAVKTTGSNGTLSQRKF